MLAGHFLICFRERKTCFDIYDDSEHLEWYRVNRYEIVYITDLLHKDLCPLIDAVTKVLLTLRYFGHHRL